MDSNFRIQCLWHKRTVVTRSRNEEGLWGFVLLLLLWIIQYYSLLIRSDEQYLLIYWQKIKPRRQKNLTCPSSRSGSTAHRDPLCLPLYAPWAASKARSVSTVRRNVLSDTSMQSVTYPAVNLYINGFKVAVCSSDVDELNQRSDTDALWGRGKKEKHKLLQTLKSCRYSCGQKFIYSS